MTLEQLAEAQSAFLTACEEALVAFQEACPTVAIRDINHGMHHTSMDGSYESAFRCTAQCTIDGAEVTRTA